MNKHTPLPWAVGGIDKNGQAIVRSETIEIATFWHHCIESIEQQMHANAEFVVRACNSHYDLLAALEATINAMVMQIKREREEFHISAEAAMAIWDEAICLGNAAIAKAKGTS